MVYALLCLIRVRGFNIPCHEYSKNVSFFLLYIPAQNVFDCLSCLYQSNLLNEKVRRKHATLDSTGSNIAGLTKVVRYALAKVSF